MWPCSPSAKRQSGNNWYSFGAGIPPMKQKYALYVTVFITGMSVMAVELTASRLLAPSFGTSMFVWTNLIGVVLLALSLGYYFGGRLADRNAGRSARKTLYGLILATGALVCLIPALDGPVFSLAFAAMGGVGAFDLLSVFAGHHPSIHGAAAAAGDGHAAGGTSARILHHFLPRLELVGVEIDPLIIDVSRKFFGLDRVPIRIVAADGRVFLQQTSEFEFRTF